MKIEELKQAGFDDAQISEYVAKQNVTLQQAGFSQSEINKHFGVDVKNILPADDNISPAFERLQLPVSEIPKQNDFAFNNMQKADSTPDEMKRIYDAAHWLDINPDYVVGDENKTMPSMRANNLTIGQKIGRFFVGEGENYTPEGIGEQTDYWTKKITRPVIRTFLKASFGRLWGTPDIGWAVLKKTMPDLFDEDNEYSTLTLEQAMDKAMNYNPSGFVRSVGDIAEFASGYKTASNLLKPYAPAKNLSVLQKANIAALTAGLSKTGRELSKQTADVIDPATDYQYEGALGVLKDMGIMGGFSLGNSLVGFGMSKFAESASGKMLINAYDKAMVKFAKNFPKLADKVMANPQDEFQKMANDTIWSEYQVKPEDFTPEQQIGAKHLAREFERRIRVAYSRYAKNPSPDIVYARSKPADIQTKGFLPQTVNEIKPIIETKGVINGEMQGQGQTEGQITSTTTGAESTTAPDLQTSSPSATIPSMAEKQAARDNIEPSKQQPSGKMVNVEGIDFPLNNDGTITVYHRTNQSPEQIAKTGWKTNEPNKIYVGNFKEGQISGYGKNVVELHVKPEDLSIDDEFPSGEAHFIITPEVANVSIAPQNTAEAGKGILNNEQKTAILNIAEKSYTSSRKPSKPQKVYRGTKQEQSTGGASYGKGLYTAGNKKDAEVFGEVVELGTESLPQSPMIFDGVNQFQNFISEASQSLGYKRVRDFNKDFPDIGVFIRQLGNYDGVQIGHGKDAWFVKYSNEQSSFNTPAPEDGGQVSPEQYPQGQKPVELSDTQRNKLIKQTTESILQNDVYLTELGKIEQQAIEIDVGKYYIPESYRGEVEGVIGKIPKAKSRQTALQKMFTFNPEDSATDWSLAARTIFENEFSWDFKEVDISEFVGRVKSAYESKAKKGGINIEALDIARRSGDLSLELDANKLEWIKGSNTVDEVNEKIIQWAKSYDISPEDIQGELIAPENVELSLSEMADVTSQEKKMRAKIAILAANKGMTKKALEDIKLKIGGQKKLVNKTKTVGLDKLNDIYEAIKKVRPKRVDYKQVISKKTETQIYKLKNNMLAKGQMTDAAWQNILSRETNGLEPKYTNSKRFITQQQARNVLKRMHNTATLMRLVEPYNRAINDNPDISDAVEKINAFVASKGKPQNPNFLESMRYVMQKAERVTGSPIYSVYQALTDIHRENQRSVEVRMMQIQNTVGEEQFKSISSDDAALKRVADFIDSKSNLENKPEMPKDITPEEVKYAQAIENILKEYELNARLGKFLRWYDMNMPLTGEGAMADLDNNKKGIMKAVDIYDTQGIDALIEYLKTQTWGVKKSGYDPMELTLRGISRYKLPPRAMGNGHIKISEAVEYTQQERNILQRLASYTKQMDNLTRMSPLINTLVQLFDDNAAKFGGEKEWGRMKNFVEAYLDELKGYNIEKNELMKIVNRILSQAAQTLIENSFSIFMLNLAEETMLSTDKTMIFDALFGEKLSAEDDEYNRIYVQQMKALLDEYYMVNEPPILPFLEPFNTFAKKIALTGKSDVISRNLAFKGKINQIRRAFEQSDTIEEMMKLAKFDDFTPEEQKMALGILAKDGKDAMARYLARNYTSNVHGLYIRSERSPAEMGSGKGLTNLMNYPRFVTERIAKAAAVVLDPKASPEAKTRNAKTLFSVLILGNVLGSIYSTYILGIKYNPYNFFNIANYKLGGLYFGALKPLTDLSSATFELIYADKEKKERILNQLPTLITAVPAMFMPFYNHAIRTLEVAAGTKHIDALAIRKVREMLDDDYHVRPEAYEFNNTELVHLVQYILLGRSVDSKEKTETNKPVTRTKND